MTRSQDDLTTRPKWRQQVRQAYVRARPWVVAAFVFAGLLGPLFPAEYQYVPLTALLGVVAQALLEVLGHVAMPQRTPHVRTVSDVIDGLPEMELCLQDCRAQRGQIEIRWIGMTMFNAWNSLQKALDRLADQNVKNVKVEIAMLSADWLDRNPVNPEWDGAQADAMAAKIEMYFSAARLGMLGWSHGLYRYGHMPMVHGGLIGDRCLFLAISRWDDGCLKAGQKSYEVHRSDDGEYARDRMAVFTDWFRFCKGERSLWYETNSQARKSREAVQRGAKAG